MEYKHAIKWGKALISGEYKQIQGWLAEDGGFCCMGVCTDIFKPEGYKEELKIGTLPWGLKNKGIFREGDVIAYRLVNGEPVKFAALNDNMKESFLDIGTFILVAAEAGYCEKW